MNKVVKIMVLSACAVVMIGIVGCSKDPEEEFREMATEISKIKADVFMEQFRSMAPEAQQSVLLVARRQLAEMQGRVCQSKESRGVMAEEIEKGRSQQMATSASICGRNLYVAMIQANIEREACGMPSIWPQTAGSAALMDKGNDISGMAFTSSTEYFKVLFDVAARNDPAQWKPYVDVDMSVLKLHEKSAFCDWIVAANIRDEEPDVVPVLVSSNVDPSMLKTTYDGESNAAIPFGSKVGRTDLPWCDDFVVVIRKGGSAQVFGAKDFKYNVLYNNQSFTAPHLKYLDVK